VTHSRRQFLQIASAGAASAAFAAAAAEPVLGMIFRPPTIPFPRKRVSFIPPASGSWRPGSGWSA
jgi:hypothetical protein